ncbi:hypothetical protein [Emticicia sp. 21SJ11W-3]|nr:hypothetical protein [Emticicia sp. 21SJ11W-3]UTA68387.1 hypothetical protein MB380_00945 [Emticicia sp. 21SJ11W-3]
MILNLRGGQVGTNNSIRVAAEACKVMGINADFVPYGASLSGQIGF